MAILLSVIGAFGDLVQSYDFITDKQIFQINDYADLLQIKCLRFIDCASNTIFNKLQVKEIKKEIFQLRECSEIDQSSLDLIEKVVDYVLQHRNQELYIYFEGD